MVVLPDVRFCLTHRIIIRRPLLYKRTNFHLIIPILTSFYETWRIL